MYADNVQIAMTSAPVKLLHRKTNTESFLKHLKSWYDQNDLKLTAKCPAVRSQLSLSSEQFYLHLQFLSEISTTTTTSNGQSALQLTPEPFLAHTNTEPTHDAVAHNQLNLLNQHPSRKPRRLCSGANY
ncbi:hypothetical protein FHG87_024048 [Trinorchestia longiramus]|nr:hypothetical protein FHG87_024048 [Trinorchestia longiramus]